MNQNLDIFIVYDINTPLNFDVNSIGRFGFIIPKKYENKTIYLPSDVIEEKSFVHHGSVLKFTLGKLFKYEKSNFFESFVKINPGDDDMFFMDSEEIAYSSFIASLDSIVFLNTSTVHVKSGMIFIPKDLSSDDSRIERLNQMIYYLKDGENFTSHVVVVPSLNKALNSSKMKVYELDEYISKTKKKNKHTKSLVKKMEKKGEFINVIR